MAQVTVRSGQRARENARALLTARMAGIDEVWPALLGELHSRAELACSLAEVAEVARSGWPLARGIPARRRCWPRC